MSIKEYTTQVESRLAVDHQRTQDTINDTANVASIGASGSDNICGAKNANIGTAPESPTTVVRSLLGHDVVLLPIPHGQKGPRFNGWQNTSVEQTTEPAYLRELEGGNIGVLLGTPSNGLCTIDIDDDTAVEPFLELNPDLTDTLRTKGKRGVQIWIRMTGTFPKLAKLKTDSGADWGEWRADGGQSVIYGIHPEGMAYQRVVDASPKAVAFEDIIWPVNLELPWESADTNPEYDALVEAEGAPFAVSKMGGVTLNQMFFVKRYMLEHEIVYDAGLGDFYEYCNDGGLWKKQTVESIKRRFAADLTETAKVTQQPSILLKRTDTLFNGLVALLRAQCEERDCFADRPAAIHVQNGMLCFAGSEVLLKSVHPQYRSRNMCPHAYTPQAECPIFLNELLGKALSEADIRLLQKWAGGALLGVNHAQRILLLTGTAGGGKSTLMSILERIIGLDNVAQLRTDQLADHFELFGYVGKTLLTGKDVDGGFLLQKGAHVLKALVGGDLLVAEKKGFNDRVQLRGNFNVAITCNTDLNIRLEGDEGAWRRRMIVIKYENPAPARRITDFADQLLAKEGAGILRWMVQGAIELMNDLNERGDYILTDVQQQRIDNLMSQSDSVRVFVSEGVRAGVDSSVTNEELLSAYYEYCDDRGWPPLPINSARWELSKRMAEIHHVHQRHDIRRGIGSARGFKKVALVKGGQSHEN